MRILFLLLFAATISVANAQQVSGFAKDKEGKPLSGATISLMKDSGAVVKLAVSKENGAFAFTNIKAGRYRISATSVGYQPIASAPFAFSDADVAVPELLLTKSAGNLKDVTITAKKPMVEVKADKTIVNVEGTINATGADAMELLRRSPGVNVDKDDNLSLSGKNGVQVFIDGRPTPLAGQDLANYLKSMQSSNIEAIELITNPSAKYEAAGNAGIINIRLKKNKSLGVNGSVNAGWNIGKYSKYNGGFSLNYRNKSVNIFGNYSYNQGRNAQSINLHRVTLDTLFDQVTSVRFDNRSHNFKVGADYFINKKSTLGVMVNGSIADPKFSNYSRTPITYVPTNVVDRILVADNKSTLTRNNYNYNLNYTYNSPDGKSLTLNADRGNYDINNDQFQPNYYYNPSGTTIINSVIYHMIAPSKINISSGKVDWEQNFMKGKLGFGGKTAFINSDNDFQRYNVYGTTESLDKDRSNRFVYKENINALYVNYNRAFKGVMMQIGLRGENTVTEGTSTGLKFANSVYSKYDSTFKRNYTDLFPSAAITFNKNPASQLSLTYSRRIDRPFYQDLNPFEMKLDEYTFQKGNINLRPQYTNSFGITHVYKSRLNTTLNYSRVKDLFTIIPDTTEKSKAFISKKNLATQDVVSLNISFPFQYKSFSTFASVNSNYSHYNADYGAGRKVDIEAFGLNFNMQNSIKFAKTWTAELGGFYNAPTVYMGSFKGQALWSINTGLQKQLFKTKMNVRASVSDIFNTLQFKGTTEFAGQKSVFSQKSETRQFRLGISYRFGNNGVKPARQRNSGSDDENKRTQGGNGGIGIGG
jgi:iron complex outermembrane receptor protein